jgi:protein-tyrosine phosphatase
VWKVADDNGNRKRILFVCLGNICRSPAAEGVLLDYLKRHDLEGKVEVDSAGTASYHVGKLADERMRRAAMKRGVELVSRARLLSPRDLSSFDLIVAMDRENYRNTQALGVGSANSHVRMLSDFLDGAWPKEVPDPYYGGEDGFEFVLDMLQAAMPKLVAYLIPEENRGNESGA